MRSVPPFAAVPDNDKQMTKMRPMTPREQILRLVTIHGSIRYSQLGLKGPRKATGRKVRPELGPLLTSREGLFPKLLVQVGLEAEG